MANNFSADGNQQDAIKQLISQGLKQAASVLSTILRCKAQITVENVAVSAVSEITTKYSAGQIIVKIAVSNDVQSQGFIGISQGIAGVLCDILTGKSGKNPSPQIGTAELNMISQIMGQFLSSLSASLSQVSGKKISMSCAEVKSSAISTEISALETTSLNAPMVVITSQMVLENITQEQLIQVIPLAVFDEMLAAGTKSSKTGQRIEPLNLSPLEKSASTSSIGVSNLLADVPLQLTVELGRTKMLLKDILELGVGSIIELDQLAGEAVEIILNNKPLARGEVVVIDENLGVRLTHIINPQERI